MSLDRLEQFLGSNQNEYLDFLRRFQADPNSISNEEAGRRYQELMSKLPPDVAAQAHTQVLAQFSPDERRQIAAQLQGAHDDPNSAFHGFDARDLDQAAEPRTLATLSQRASDQDPGLFGNIFGQGQGSPLNSQIGKLLLSALAAYLTQRMLSGTQANSRGAPGGAYGGGPLGGQGSPLGGQSGGLGDILGGLLGGQAGSQSGQGGGLGDILGGLLGGQSGSQSGQGGGLGDILGGLLGGQAGTQPGSTPNAPEPEQPKPAEGSHRKYK
jgi:hypothetical protein